MAKPFPASVEAVRNAASERGLAIDIIEMTETTRSAEEAARACQCHVGQIVKSLVFAGRESGKPYLLLVSGDNRVDETGVAAHLGEGLKRPDAKQVRDWTGFAIGGIPPLGHATALITFIDRDLFNHQVVWAAAGTPFHVFLVAPAALAEATGAQIIKVK